MAALLLWLPTGCRNKTDHETGTEAANDQKSNEATPPEPGLSDSAVFALYLRLENTEISKDRNSRITAIRIKDRDVDYYFKYEGFPHRTKCSLSRSSGSWHRWQSDRGY